MSVVAVRIHKTKITIGADSVLTSGHVQEKDKFAKLIKINNLIIGQSGQSRDFTLLTLFAKNHEPREATEFDIVEYLTEYISWCKKKIDNDYKINSNFFIIFKKKVFSFDADFQIKEVKTFDAIGVGREFALSAMYLGSSVSNAVKISCEFSAFCREPINIIEVDL